MTVIFSNVHAEITDDLVSKFPNEFDFDAMLKKVCEDAEVFIEACKDEKLHQRYKLTGLWLAMEKAYRHLVTTLAMYGIRHGDDTSDEILDFSRRDVEDKTFRNLSADLHWRDNISRSVLEDSKNRKSRRPRKSAVQSRKLIAIVKSAENYEEEEEESEVAESYAKEDDNTNETDSNHSMGKENDRKLIKESKSDEQSLKGKLPKPEFSGKPFTPKRGRPKKADTSRVSEFHCSQCTFIAKGKSKLKTHMQRIHISAPSTCSICQKVFPNKRYMVRHKACHREPQHCCDICGKMYKIKKAMIDHKKTHEPTYQKPSFKCAECPKSFCGQYVLDCHIRDVHQGLKKSFLCSVCGKSFTSKHSLTEHSNAHIGIKPYACDVCNKTFSYDSALRDHKFSHLDSKQFWCKHCQKGFCQRSGLKMHMRTHRLQKMFTCSECGRGFTQKQSLQRHERVHKGEKPYICKHCGKYFTDSSIIRRHLILVHKIEKPAHVWREDIICTILSESDHHVHKIGEEDKTVVIERQKEEVSQNVGLHNKSSSKKGPSRAFHRVYPRKVVILDDEDNVISSPGISASATLTKTDFVSNKVSSIAQSNHATLQLKTIASQYPANTTVIGTSESGLEMESQIQYQRLIDPSHWETLTAQLSKGAAGNTHLDHILLEDPNQSEITRNLSKIIKCESVQNTEANSNIQQGEYQTPQSPRYSPVSFNAVSLSNNAKSLESQFEALTTPLPHISGQYYNIRGTGHSAVPFSFYYSHLASQLGINISTDLPYVSATSTSSAPSGSHTTQQTTIDSTQIPTSLVIHKPDQDIESESSSYQQPLTPTAIVPSGLDTSTTSCIQNMPSILVSNSIHGQREEMVKEPCTESTNIVLNQELPDMAQTETHEPDSSNPIKCVVRVNNSVDDFLQKE